MNGSAPPRSRVKKIALLVGAAVLLVPLGYTVANALVGGEPEPYSAFLQIDRQHGDRCAEGKDREWMRFHHMVLLKAMRDAGVRRGGKRRVTLADCRRCHANRREFCNKCHEAVNLDPDCFGCHYYPEVPDEAERQARISSGEGGLR